MSFRRYRRHGGGCIIRDIGSAADANVSVKVTQMNYRSGYVRDTGDTLSSAPVKTIRFKLRPAHVTDFFTYYCNIFEQQYNFTDICPTGTPCLYFVLVVDRLNHCSDSILCYAPNVINSETTVMTSYNIMMMDNMMEKELNRLNINYDNYNFILGIKPVTEDVSAWCWDWNTCRAQYICTVSLNNTSKQYLNDNAGTLHMEWGNLHNHDTTDTYYLYWRNGKNISYLFYNTHIFFVINQITTSFISDVSTIKLQDFISQVY